jgi:ribulose-phosphate 3-epimerase
MELCASVLAANHAYIGRDIARAERLGIRRFHFDVADGYYAENLIFGPQLIRDVRRESNSYLDAHLAVNDMNRILKLFLDSGSHMIVMQFEACENVDALIDSIHSHGMDAGLCLTLDTDITKVLDYLPKIELLNLLAVNPGIGGQEFRPSVLQKIKQASSAVLRLGAKTRISVDGGVNCSTIGAAMKAGADIGIVGSGIFCGDMEYNIRKLQEVIG